jgi:hypothetical protein
MAARFTEKVAFGVSARRTKTLRPLSSGGKGGGGGGGDAGGGAGDGWTVAGWSPARDALVAIWSNVTPGGSSVVAALLRAFCCESRVIVVSAAASVSACAAASADCAATACVALALAALATPVAPRVLSGVIGAADADKRGPSCVDAEALDDGAGGVACADADVGGTVCVAPVDADADAGGVTRADAGEAGADAVLPAAINAPALPRGADPLPEPFGVVSVAAAPACE